jgi:hypothetical protein
MESTDISKKDNPDFLRVTLKIRKLSTYDMMTLYYCTKTTIYVLKLIIKINTPNILVIYNMLGA